jgi:3-(3-hydroxy-phenyl)propionate hydroxylase
VVYTFHSSLATQWRRGRLLLAGDAAHQMPPFLGQGMGSGLRDALNLGWKLRDVVRGRAPDRLLDSYETERMAHVRAYIELAVELGSVIQATDPDKARQRDAQLLANPTMLKPLAPRLGPGLHGDAPAPAGTRAEQPRLGDGRRLDDHVGYGFALLGTPAFIAMLPACLRQKLDAIDAAVLAADGEAADYLERLGASAIVIRPDRHILGIASSAPELDRVIARMHR